MKIIYVRDKAALAEMEQVIRNSNQHASIVYRDDLEFVAYNSQGIKFRHVRARHE